ncbi:rho GDP-dissociation inhibitor 1-like [Euphorbia lathyris]|uniref:rho GDP-dissociation inhibitor 1-like n=1 Tax=Euphorbia lathyris TaxID=212925 RepID=UPI0033133A06
MESEKKGVAAAAAAGSSNAGGFCEKQEMEEKSVSEVVIEENDDDNFEEEDEDIEAPVTGFVPGPLLSLKEQLEKDKHDDSLRRWKEKLLGNVETELNGKMEPEVKFHSIGIVSDDIGEVNTPLPIGENQAGRVLFTLKEGSRYQLKMTFSVLHNIVSGLTYSNTVWKGGIRVHRNKGMLGTFAPQREPYVYSLEEETTPSGVLARGTYSAKLRFIDDDKRCHMELKYSFEIKKSC